MNISAAKQYTHRRLYEAINYHKNGDFLASGTIYEEILKINPRDFDALHLLGALLSDMGKHSLALTFFESAVKIDNSQYAVYLNRAKTYTALRDYDSAIQNYQHVLRINPTHINAHHQIANLYCRSGNFIKGIEFYDNALFLDNRHIPSLNNKANAYIELNKAIEAIEIYYFIATIESSAKNFNNLGSAYLSMNKAKDALCAFVKAIDADPNYYLAYANAAVASIALFDFESAIDFLEQAEALAPHDLNLIVNIATLMRRLGLYNHALTQFKKAYSIDPSTPYLIGNIVQIKYMICDWSLSIIDMEFFDAPWKHKIRPFMACTLFNDPELLLHIAKDEVKNVSFTTFDAPLTSRRHGRIRLGYFSADFHNHATAYLMAQLFEKHDKDKFELYAFSFGPNCLDEMRARISTAFDHFFDVRSFSDQEIADLSRANDIDIAIDLKGYTQDSRPGIFNYRCAPIQINYLGFPGTMGSNAIDYIIADEVIIPQDDQKYYTEKVIYIPGCYQVNDSSRKISDRIFTKSDLGLPENGFIFCCFNNNYKITPDIFDTWMEILKAVPGSVLWLLKDNEAAAFNLKNEALKRGIDSNRLIFAPRMRLDEHLARQRTADLFLDTTPCNAHTTASDALWAGLPLLTLSGSTFASRVAASLLTALDMTDLITTNIHDYRHTAIHIASNPTTLQELKNRLQQQKEHSDLFDGAQFARKLETCLIDILINKEG